jgi:DNA-binding response OmpR family regulator
VTQRLPRVLLVEDDASIRRFVQLALEDCGVDLVQAGSSGSGHRGPAHGGPFVLLSCVT